MKKIIIPTILTATILIAGIFAFVPVDKATAVHDDIIAAITGSQDAVLLDLEEKIKLSSDSKGSVQSGDPNSSSTITIRALDDGQPTTFNLKECYLRGTSDGNLGNEILVTAISIDGVPISDVANGGLAEFGPRSAGSGTTMVELISGMGFTTGLGADDTITMSLRIDEGETVNLIFCIAFVQNSADLEVIITEPVD